jgi:hypothetical protein
MTNHTFRVTFQSGLVWEVVASSPTDAAISAAELNPHDPVVRASREGEW